MKYLFIILPLFCNANIDTTIAIQLGTQSIDTFLNATASTNTWLWSNTSGIRSNGDIYFLNFKQTYSGTTPTELQAVRIDAVTKEVNYTNLYNSLSSSSSLWRITSDSAGEWWIGTNTGGRNIYRLNPKGDSLTCTYYGNAIDSAALAYSIVMGYDYNMYFGGSSSNTSTSASYWNRLNNTFTSYGEADPNQDYTVYVTGNATWFYRQVGQRNNTFELFATRKSDGYTKLIASNTGIMNSVTRVAGIGFAIGGVWYRIADTTLIPDPTIYWLTPDIYHCETYNGAQCGLQYPVATSFFNSTTNRLSWTANGDTGSVAVNSGTIANTLRKVYPDQYNSRFVYYQGEYYGDWYKYDTLLRKATDLGSTGFNIYSALQVNDSIIYIAGYSSGVLAKWNKNLPWTCETFYNGALHHLSDSTNPQLVDYYRTYGGFHHPTYLIKIDSLLISAGPVERVATNWGIATYDMVKDSMYGYDFTKNGVLVIQDAKQWRKKILVSTVGTGAKLYIYDPATNLMDSIETGFSDNGKLYIVGDKLIGVANNKIYNYNLATKTLINSHTYASNSISFSYQMPDGRILITSSGITLPVDMSFPFVNYTGNATGNMVSGGNFVYTLSGDSRYVTRLNNRFYQDQNCVTPAGIFAMIERKLNLKQ